ncbi:nitroreductase [Gymnodinialimonas sp. 2305UL16-5]|uniref:nitroreductase family protein n=1 Tax=Gymnodinialimonas mytili TaxID=3126503 RepID=UPI0030A6EA03
MADMVDTPPLAPTPAALGFLLSRRSRPPRMLGMKVPDRATIEVLLTAAARVPDHGKLEPWRFIVLQHAACQRLGALAQDRGATLAMDHDKVDKTASGFRDAHLIIAVVSAPKPSDRIPVEEQTASASAACLSLVNAALAAGWGACWLTGWASSDRDFLQTGLGLSASEALAGFIHIGEEQRPPPERPRPDISALTTWQDT